jgi:hypothetical protein
MSVDSLPGDAFVVSFRVRFDDFNNNYPMCLSSQHNSLQCHGWGPAYGSNRNRIGFYIYTISGKGPHGRGITGISSQGEVRSSPLNVGQWYNIRLEKTRRSLSIEVDGNVCKCEIPESMSDEDFDMKPSGRCSSTSLFTPHDGVHHQLHGEISDFLVSSSHTLIKEISARPSASCTVIDASRQIAQAAPATVIVVESNNTNNEETPAAYAEAVVTIRAVSVMTAEPYDTDTTSSLRPQSLTDALRQLQEALVGAYISQTEYEAMRTKIMNKFCS